MKKSILLLLTAGLLTALLAGCAKTAAPAPTATPAALATTAPTVTPTATTAPTAAPSEAPAQDSAENVAPEQNAPAEPAGDSLPSPEDADLEGGVRSIGDSSFEISVSTITADGDNAVIAMEASSPTTIHYTADTTFYTFPMASGQAANLQPGTSADLSTSNQTAFLFGTPGDDGFDATCVILGSLG